LGAPHFLVHDHGDDAEEVPSTDDRWNPDHIELTTVGIDIGSSTSHLMFSRLHLRRMGLGLSSRYIVVRRVALARPPIRFTPYAADGTIDARGVRVIVDDAFRAAGLTPKEIDTGAVILTGVAAERVNARAIADLFAETSGRFVCATAGHRLEAVLAAHGAGAVEISREREAVVLHVDVGGGTSKLAVIRSGVVAEVAAIAVGARLVAFDSDGVVVRLEDAAIAIAGSLGLHLRLGEALPASGRRALTAALAGALGEAMSGETLSPLAADLMLTEPLMSPPRAELVTFSGGVSEFIYGEEDQDFGDLARDLGRELAPMTKGARPAELIRATAIGVSQFTIQVSGDTLFLSRPALLPLRNLPVVHAALPDHAEPHPDAVASAIQAGFRRLDLVEGSQPVAVVLDWHGAPAYRNLRALAEGIQAALPVGMGLGLPLVLVFTQDVARLMGGLLRDELAVTQDIVAIDGVELRELDFIDIGQLVDGRRVVPVVVKSLVFADPRNRPVPVHGTKPQ
jgi:ethanolamine utilization protein EutA